MLTIFWHRFFLFILLAWTFVHLSFPQNLPEEMQDKMWFFKSEEGSGSIFVYNNRFLFEGKQWDLVSQKGNFMSFKRTTQVTVGNEQRYLYKCWLYKRQNASLFYYFPMTGLYEGDRAHTSTDATLDICDFCTTTDTKLYTLHQDSLPCGCTPQCSDVTINNVCTNADHDTSTAACQRESTATETATDSTSSSAAATTTTEATTTQEATTTAKEATTTQEATTQEATTTAKEATTTEAITTQEKTTTKETATQEATTTTSTATTTTTATTTLSQTASVINQNDASTATTITTAKQQTTVPNPEEPAGDTSTKVETTLSAKDKLGIQPDAIIGIVSGTVAGVYLAVAIVGCGCCFFILGRRRKRNKKGKESRENLVPEGTTKVPNKFYLQQLPSVFHRIDE